MLHIKLARSICFVCGIFFLQHNIIFAQGQYSLKTADTLHLDIKQTEKLFLDSNLQLLAQHYNIQSGKALVEQAKKWDNPVLNTDQNLYSNSGFFQHSIDANGNPQGEIFVQVQQLIKTAGKRGKSIDLARTNVNLAEWQFKSLMRNLRAQLFRDFYTITQLQGMAALYTENQERLTKLLSVRGQELKAGNIAKKEYLRVQALLVSLQQDMTGNAKDLNDAQNELKTILRLTGNVVIQPVVSGSESTDMPDVSIMQLIDTARQNNTDYQLQVYQLQYNMQNLRLQKAMAVPDLTVGTEFDQSANYAPNYFGLAVSLPLPFWDRNQGNIKSAHNLVKQQEYLKTDADVKLQNDVLNAYQKLLYTIRLSSSDNSTFYKEYYQLQKNIVESYNNRQINLIEFLDYFNDYQAIREKELKQLLDLRLAKEELNDLLGTDLIK